MPSSIQIHNQMRELQEANARDSSAFNAAEGDERSRLHDAIVERNGRIAVLDDMLRDQLEAEDRLRESGGLPLAAPAPQPSAPANVADLYLGTRDEFSAAGGLQARYGKKYKFGIEQVQNATLTLELPTRKSYALPENIIEMPMGVIDTLTKGTTDSNLEYMVPKAFTNNADLWDPGEVKKESSEEWDEDTANLFTVAHHIPISKQTAYHYGQLRSLVGNDLMMGLKMKEAAYCLNLNDGNGKKGILNKDGIQTYTAKKGEKFYDSLRRMINESWMKTGFRPDYVAVHPNVLVELDLQKTSEGAYLALQVNGRLWGLPVVEDINLVSGSTGQEKYGALVYNHTAATWYTSEADALTMGYVNDQFTRNEFTLLAEGEHLITVQRPKSFVHIVDAISVGTGA